MGEGSRQSVDERAAAHVAAPGEKAAEMAAEKAAEKALEKAA